MHKHCPNCAKEFIGNPHASDGEYCQSCWSAWCQNDGSFERRTVPFSTIAAKAVADARAFNQANPIHGAGT